VFAGEELRAAVLRGALAPGTRVRAPALCAQAEATVLVPPGWAGTVDATGSLLLRRQA
jgi:N-methylhydantoinase A